jgi:hypothetical protein
MSGLVDSIKYMRDPVASLKGTLQWNLTIMSFASPFRIFVFLLSPFFVIYMYHTGGRMKRRKQT